MDKILITRPREDFRRTADSVALLGFEALSAPSLLFKILDFELPVLEDFAALVFTSANGVRAVRDYPEMRELPCYVVGVQTAKTAEQLGFRVLLRGANDVVSLADKIALDYKKQGFDKPLLHVSGTHMAGNLSKILVERSIVVQRIQAYIMDEVNDVSAEILTAIEGGNITGILFYSSRSAKIFIENMRKNQLLAKISEIPTFYLSKNIADAVAKPYLKHIYYVNQPDEAKLLTLMQLKLKN